MSSSGSAESSPPKPARADGVRNRQRILTAARELFAQRSAAEVQLDDVAVAAGVGRATLFRHIQSKEALIDAIYGDRVLDLQDLAERALGEPTAWDGFALLLRVTAVEMYEDRGLYDYSVRLYAQAPDDPRYAAVALALSRVIERAHHESAIRPDFALPDLLPLLGFTVAASADRLDYYTDLLLAGLRIDAGATPRRRTSR